MTANLIKAYKPHIKTATLIVILDTIIVIASTIYFQEIEVGLYSALAIYVLGKTLDVFFEGIDFTKKILIITPKWKEVAERINKEMGRGVTTLHGQGFYKQEEKEILLCVIPRTEMVTLRKIIDEVDSSAFIIITNAREVYGEGFKDN